MPIKFKLIERKDWSKDAPEGATLFYAQPVGSKGAKTKEEFQVATMMKKPGITFIPGKMIQEAREKITFTRVKDPNEAKGGTPDSESPDEI